MKRIALAALLTAQCSHNKAPAETSTPEAWNLPGQEDLASVDARAIALVDELPAFASEGGWYAPRRDGQNVPEGDSLLWQGLAMSVAPCERQDAILSPVEAMSQKRAGGWVRFEPLPDQAPRPDGFLGNEVSRDGVTGMMVGIWSVNQRCPEMRPRLVALWQSFIDYVHREGADLFLFPGAEGGIITPPLRFVMDLLSHKLLGHASPSLEAKIKAELGHASTAKSVVDGKDPCYPLSIGTLQIILAAKMGRALSGDARNAYCGKTSGTNLPVTDWLCGRAAARPWLEADFEPFEYRHQRCPAWESQDLDTNEQSHHLDWLVLDSLARAAW